MNKELIKQAFKLGYEAAMSKSAQLRIPQFNARRAAGRISDWWNNKTQTSPFFAGVQGFYDGAVDGLHNYANNMTFGMTDRLGLTDAQNRMKHYSPAVRRTSDTAGKLSRTAALTALGVAAGAPALGGGAMMTSDLPNLAPSAAMSRAP